MSRLLATVLVTAGLLAAQGDPVGTTRLSDRIVWDKSYPEMKNPDVESAVVDAKGVLWLSIAGRMVRVDPDGKYLGTTELLGNAFPGGPKSYESKYMLAAAPDGVVGLLISYFTSAYRPIGARFTRLNADGSAAGFSQVAGSDRLYTAFTALSDNQFLALGQTGHLSLLRFDASARASWRRDFSPEPESISVSPLAAGTSCIASSGGAGKTQLLKVDSSGAEMHRTTIASSNFAVAPGRDDGCILLHDAGVQVTREECTLTAFDSKLRRRWSAPVRFRSETNPLFSVAVVKDGYIVTGQARRKPGRRLFAAKYDFTGKPIWTLFDDSRAYARFVLPVGDGFYFVGAEPRVYYGLHVVRGK